MTESYEAKYQQLLKDFGSNLQRFFMGVLSKNKIPVIITMSRKMARIMDWLRLTGTISFPRNAIVISEYAVYFCLGKLMIQHKGQIEVLITDDIVNTGTSISRIAACIAAHTKRKSFVLPIIKRMGCGQIEYCEQVIQDEPLDNDFINYCIGRNVENIMLSGMPLDMEFPIIETSLSTKSVNAVNVEDALKRAFPDCTVYSSTHDINGKTLKNYSVLFDKYKNNLYVSSDFSKLRIFVSNEKMRIEAYSPQTINESVFTREQLFNDKNLSTLWNCVKDGAGNIVNNEDANVLAAFNDNKVLSEIVMLNYLYSFVFLKQNIKNVNIFFNLMNIESQCNIDSHSLALLVSPDKSEEMVKVLNSVLYSELGINLGMENLLYSLDDNEVSADIKDSYESNNTLHLLQCLTIEEGMAEIFHNQSKTLLKGKYAYESFASLTNKLTLHVKSDSVLEKVHRCMDFMIDDASVTPAYVTKRRDGNIFWKRMFRAGDNALLLDKLSSVIIYVFDIYTKISHRTTIEKKEFATVLSMLLANCSCKGESVFTNGKLSINNNATYSCPTFINIDSINLLSYVENNRYIDSVNIDNIECYKKTITKETTIVAQLNQTQRQYVYDMLSFIWKYSKHEVFNFRYVMLNLNISSYENIAKVYKKKILENLIKCKSENASFTDLNDVLYASATLLVDIQQANYLLLKQELPSITDEETNGVKNIWESIYNKCPKTYDDEYCFVSEAMDTILLMLMAYIDKFILNDKDSANATCQMLSENKMGIDSFVKIICNDADYDCEGKIVPIVDVLVQTIHNIFE